MAARLGVLVLALAAAIYADLVKAAGSKPLSAEQHILDMANWIAKTQGLSVTTEMPTVRFVTADELMRKRYGPLYRGGAMSVPAASVSVATGGEHSTPKPQSLREVLAVYDDVSRTIYLSEGWNPASVPHQSILVHEMVHHLQNQAAQRFDCPAAREKPAYLAQKRWLEARGLDLEREFEIDMFTIVAMAICT